MKLAIVDDESVYRSQIANLIDSVCGREDVSCFMYSDGSELIRSFENGFSLDAIFLDIEMKDVDGMTAARKVREYSKDIPIIFLTSHTELAMDGYEVDAFRFLSKPVNEVKLKETLADLEKKLKVDEKITAPFVRLLIRPPVRRFHEPAEVSYTGNVIVNRYVFEVFIVLRKIFKRLCF